MRLALPLLSLPALAAAQEAPGDPASGAALFDRQCTACHLVRDPGGEVLAGRSGRTGPNLWGVAGRTPGTEEGFRYGAAMVAYGQTGAVWGADNFIPYVQDPTGFLRGALGDPGARARMAYQVRDPGEAADLWAYLSTFTAP